MPWPLPEIELPKIVNPLFGVASAELLKETPEPTLFLMSLFAISTPLTPPPIQIASGESAGRVPLLFWMVLPEIVTPERVARLIAPSPLMVLSEIVRLDCGFATEPKNEIEPS